MKKILVQLFLVILVINVEEILFACPPLQKTQLIQEQFQVLQTSTKQYTVDQIKLMKEIIELNQQPLLETDCYVEASNEISHLNDFLTHLKLQVIDLRYFVSTAEINNISIRLKKMKSTISTLLKKQNHLSRRLGASVRSLYLDELERLIQVNPIYLSNQLEDVFWVPRIFNDLNSQVEQNVILLKKQFLQLNSSSKLAQFFGKRPWKPISKNKSKLAEFLSDWKLKKTESLEDQLNLIFKSNSKNLNWSASEKRILHYLNYVTDKLKQNTFISAKQILEPVLSSELHKLKTELGLSWPLISGLAGVKLEGSFDESSNSIELLDPFILEKAIEAYKNVKNPIGRLYELVVLKQTAQMWTEIDVSQLKTDLNRISLLKTHLAIIDYKTKFKKDAPDLNSLLNSKIISDLPRDYFTGDVFKYDSAKNKIWSVGENKNDELGAGDDLVSEINSL